MSTGFLRRCVVASDHAAVEARRQVESLLREQGLEVLSFGPANADERTDYPEVAYDACAAVLMGEADGGFLLCGSGIGMSIAANRFVPIRAALCRSIEDARMARLHNDANICCLGARSTDRADIEAIVSAFLTGAFEGGRHTKRVTMLGNVPHARGSHGA